MAFFLNFFKKNNPVTLTVLVALLSLLLGWQVGQCRTITFFWCRINHAQTDLQYPPGSKESIDFKLFWQTWDQVAKKYVDKKAIDPQKMYYGAISGMVSAVGDPYTIFLPPEAQKNTQEELGGSFDGVGIELGYDKDKHLVVIAPLQGTPAESAGIKPGDIIVKIDGKDASNLSLPDAVSLIRGSKGTKVSLDIFRTGEDKTRNFILTRDTILVKSATYQSQKTPQGKKVGLIKLSRFGERTSKEWEDAISSTLNASDQGLVLDLRNNPGGFLEGARYIASEFLPYGKDVVLQEDGTGLHQAYAVNRQGRLLNLPLVVLINKGSASASEIVAGALQDYKRALLIGEQSFGKGTIQETQTLDHGTGLHITTAKWLTPQGRWIHNLGLTPDIKTEASASADISKDVTITKALEQLDLSP